METIKMLRTKAGKGYKCVLNGVWFYTTQKEFDALTSGKALSVQFRTIDSEAVRIVKEAQAKAAAAIAAPALSQEESLEETEEKWASKAE